MKLARGRTEAFLKAPDASARAILVYGPDAGLVRERLDRMSKSVVVDLSDPFRVVDIPAASLKDDPARLADEAAAIAMTGGRRVVRVRDAGDGAASAFQAFLEHPTGDALVVVEGGDLGPRSSLRKLFEGADNAILIPCYADEGEGLEAVVHETLRSHGLAIEADAVAFLVDHLGGDRKMTRSELEKLALYMGPNGGRVRMEDAAACVGDTAALSMDDLASAAAQGDQTAVQRVLDRLFGEGTSPIPILRALQRHFQRLHLLAGQMAKGQTSDQALASLKMSPYSPQLAQLRAQMPRWPTDRAAGALDLLVSAEIDCKTTGLPAEEICGRAIMQLARAAARDRGTAGPRATPGRPRAR